MENEDKAIEILKGKKFSTIGNFSYNDAFDAIIEMAKWKDAQRRTPSDDTTEGFVHIVIGEVACHETELERRIEQGKAFAESNKTVFDVAMAVAASYQEYAESQRVVIKLLSEKNDELRNHIFVLDGKLEKLELDNHSLDQVAKVFQSDLAKKDADIKEYYENLKLFNTDLCNKNAKISKLQMRNEALKRQLDESNKQIEIYAKKVRNLEADLEEDGFNDLKKDILTLVNLIPCNEENESIINDIENLLK